MQKNDVARRDDIPMDTVVRIHPLDIREYRIQPLDMLSISFETLSDENDEFDFLSKLSARSQASNANPNAAMLNAIIVDTEGMVEYPVLGKIKLAGLTLFQAKDSLQAAATRYLPDVVVRVRMLNFRFTVLGEVNGEKTVVSNNPRLTMSEAIGLAGGFGELADRSHVKIVRQNGSKMEIFYVNLLDEDFIESSNYFVQQNDVIIVPPLKQRPFRRYFTSNLAVITSTLSFALFIISLSR